MSQLAARLASQLYLAALLLTALLCVRPVQAQPATEQAATEPAEREVAPVATESFVPLEDLATLVIPEDQVELDPSVLGLPIVRVEVRTAGSRWATQTEVKSIPFGEKLSPEVARKAMRELAESGGFSDLAAFADRVGGGVILRIEATPARRVRAVQIEGGLFERSATLTATKLAIGGMVSEPDVVRVPELVSTFYQQRGFPDAKITIQTVSLDQPLDVMLVVSITPGEPRNVSQRVFVIEPAFDAQVGDLKFEYAVSANERADDLALEEADRLLAQTLRENAFTRAKVAHRVIHRKGFTYLYVYVDSGPKLIPAFEGNWSFDANDLRAALELTKGQVSSVSDLSERLRRFYEEQGFLDARISGELRPSKDEGEEHLVFTIVERERVRVERRIFACLPTAVAADDLGSEIDSVLREELPSRAFIALPAPRMLDATLSGSTLAGARPAPLELSPESTYSAEAYSSALKHVREVLFSRGYLNAAVGPLTVIRARCSSRSGAGDCIEEPLTIPKARCESTREGLPIPEPALPRDLTCTPDSAQGVRCSSRMTLHIPMHLGPLTTLWDVGFVGAKSSTAAQLAEKAGLAVGDPVSLTAIEESRRKIVAWFQNRGFAYASVETNVDLSPDKSRARVTFTVEEREKVTVGEILIEGARQTDHDLIRRRLAFTTGDTYSTDNLRLSEERLATLGPFSSVSVTLAEPEVVAKQKSIVVRVQEYPSQYLDPRGGFSTGEGLRFGLEYGHRNIASLGISLTLRIQLSYLFDFVILDSDIAQNLKPLSASERLERRNSARLSFPDIGLGPLVSFGVEAIDVRDNQRDYGLSREAIVPSLTFRPLREFVGTLSASAELNTEEIFGGQSVNDIIANNRNLEQLLRFPDGTTFVLAQRISASWDRRDVPLNATRGTFTSVDIEHVNAFPADSDDPDTQPLVSHFMKMSGRFTGYVAVTQGGAAFALSVALGANLQLTDDSKTYPDRLFYLGGSDSLRSFLSASVVPEDVAQQILQGKLKIEDVAIRGGDIWWNPRLEFRLPLGDLVGIGLFAEAGNLWVDAANGFNPFDLRYGLGGGLRFSTPVGPIAIDGGINPTKREWEDLGALHFAVGLL